MGPCAGMGAPGRWSVVVNVGFKVRDFSPRLCAPHFGILEITVGTIFMVYGLGGIDTKKLRGSALLD